MERVLKGVEERMGPMMCDNTARQAKDDYSLLMRVLDNYKRTINRRQKEQALAEKQQTKRLEARLEELKVKK